MEEGCLSFPNKFAKVIRPTEVVAEYTDRDGKRVKVKAKDLFAQAISHEVDHLTFCRKNDSRNFRIYNARGIKNRSIKPGTVDLRKE